MARLVKHERNKPYIIEKGDFPIYICACGLSRNKPYCDGSHKAARDETPGELYLYEGQTRAKAQTEY
ncbi:MAG: CDGSH iron-sulfur domain-containing protein [Candidatus Bathyarchaeia archaeon]